MIPVLKAAAMRAADGATIRSGVPSSELMENAGTALVETLRARYPDWARVVVVCGPGNNGGDGLVAARLLAFAGVRVRVFSLGDPSAYRGDPAENLARLRALQIVPEPLGDPAARRRLARELSDAAGVVDALFGTGLSRPLSGEAARVVAALNASGRPVVAADVPSGLFSDGGAVAGPAVRAALTVAFGAPKPCHVLPPASAACGRLEVVEIGITRRTLALETRADRFRMVERQDVAAKLPSRSLESHKGDFGRLAVIAGSRGKAGAALLAARGALRGGAGLVTIFCAESHWPLCVAGLPEAMAEPLPEREGAIDESAAAGAIRTLRNFDAAVIGPGLGTAAGTKAFVARLLAGTRIPIVADADALNAFQGRPDRLKRRAPLVFTPHPGEAGRLLDLPAKRIQDDRLGAVRSLARRTGGTAVLKGAHTLISDRAGRVDEDPTRPIRDEGMRSFQHGRPSSSPGEGADGSETVVLNAFRGQIEEPAGLAGMRSED